jgi:hypothetical protein
MQVQLTTQVTETKTVDIEPGYYRGKLLKETFYYLLESGVLVYISSTMAYVSLPNTRSHEREIQELVKDYLPCEQIEFEEAKDKCLCHLSHYVSFPELATAVNPAARSSVTNTMLQDPNVKEEAQQESAAAESAAQDQAMEVDSEEGSIEG